MTDGRILERVMLAFEGERVPRWVERRLAAAPVAGATLFMAFNVGDPGQVRELTAEFQRAGEAGARKPGRAVDGPLLVAADQEAGQLMALGEATTAFAGNMALGAVGDEDLAERVGAAIGREARAMGVNVVYAPVLDLAVEPGNAAGMVSWSAGLAATACWSRPIAVFESARSPVRSNRFCRAPPRMDSIAARSGWSGRAGRHRLLAGVIAASRSARSPVRSNRICRVPPRLDR